MFSMLTPVHIEILGLGIHTLGEVIVGFMALSVHHRMKHNHAIDDEIFSIMNQEWYLGLFGIVLILIGLSMEVFGKIA